MKAVCKVAFFDNVFLNFKENHIYDIYYIDKDVCWMKSENSALKTFKFKKCEKLLYSSHKVFEDYFYTLEEARKIKLLKIKNYDSSL